jgi:tight adherence protein B
LVDAAFFPALGGTVLLGGALAWTLRIERRRAQIQLQLRAVARQKPSIEQPAITLLRPRPQHRALPATVSEWLDRAFAAAGNRIGPLHLAAAAIASAAAAWSVALFAGFRPALAIALCVSAAAGAPVLLLRFAQSRYQRQFLEGFPNALDLIVRAVRAGLPLPEAIDVLTRQTRPPVSTEFRRIMDEVRIGAEMEEALQRAAARIRAPDFHFFMVSLLLQRQTGGGIAETLSSLAAIIRQRRALHQKTRALTAEAQTSAAIIAAMPVVGGTGLFLINHDLMRTLIVDPRGRFMLGLAVVSVLSGIIAMKALIKRNLR